MNPIHRTTDLVIQDYDGEILVYDLASHRAFSLNNTSAFVWRACDGKTSPAEMARLLASKTGEKIPVELVNLALDQLTENDLIKTTKSESFLNGLTRREAVRRVGLTTMAVLPMIVAITAPLAIHAASACVPGGSCLCSDNSNGRQGLPCTNVNSPCADPNCICVYRSNGANINGTCVA